MKNKLSFLGVIAMVFLLTGCSSMPVRTSPVYSLEDLYKRLDYKSEGKYRVVNIFYATSRRIDYRDDQSPVFKSELADATSYGTLGMKIDPRVRIGKMNPDQLKKNGILGLTKTERLDPDIFVKQLSDAVNASPHKSLLVLVFGYKDGFEVTAMKAAYFAYLLDVDTPVLLFDWPGDQPFGISGYKKAEDEASRSGPFLAEALTKVIHEVKPEKLWVKASSLGCQVACDAFEEMYKNPSLADNETEIDHIIFAAPDVGRDEFAAKFKDHMTSMSKKMTTYVASDDDALLISGIINRGPRLGRPKVRMEHPEQFEEAKKMLYLKSLEPEKFTLIDVTPVNHASFKHGYYLECTEFYDDLYMRMFDTKSNMNRRLYLIKAKDGADYWVMQSAR
ncbi:MAG: alpha/beta hydrolase [Candidatus Omnitrophota bacterium]